MRRAVGLALSLLFVMAGCLPDTGGGAPDAGDAASDEEDTELSTKDATPTPDEPPAPAVTCGGHRCAQNAELSIRCEGTYCIGRSAAGAWLGDCRDDGRYETDLRTDRANCGRCGRACAGGRACIEGVCTVVCAGAEFPCNGVCFDLRSDVSNCGACGRTCAAGMPCVGGVCRACEAAGWLVCGGRCVDPRADRTNCGACGRACPASDRCVAGACVACGGGLMACGDRCTDLSRTMEHCGACGHACAPDERCAAGACTPCPGATRRCGEACIEVASSQDHCGACENRCGATQRCIGGRCSGACGVAGAAACAAGTACFEGYCTGPVAVPKAPLSTSITTSARPWFRWRLPVGADGARVEVCAARSCDRPLVRWDAVGETLRAPEAFAPGVYFWRLFARRGTSLLATSSVVWEFVVRAPPPRGAYLPPARGLAVMNDLNGDGAADEATAHCVDGEGCGVLMHYGTSPGAAPPGDLFIPAPRPPTTSDGWTSLYRLGTPRPVGDIDGDGFGDLTVNVFETRLQTVAVRGQFEYVRVYLGSASGLTTTFTRFGDRSYGMGAPGNMVVYPIGDRNGDGMGDLGWWAFGTPNGQEYAEHGGPSPAMSLGAVESGLSIPSPDGLDVGDFNADGASDTVLVTSFMSSQVTANFGRGGGTSLSSCRMPPYFWGGQIWAIRDTNDDGFDDLEVTWGPERALLLGGARGLSTYTCPSP